MDNIDKINLRLEKLKEFTGSLKTLKGVTAEDLIQNQDLRLKTERLLQLAIEACIDIAEIIIIDQRLPAAADSAGAIKILGQEKIIDSEFADTFSKIVGFRNILVHDYIDIDYKQVADKVNNRLSDFERFAQEVAQFLTSKK